MKMKKRLFGSMMAAAMLSGLTTTASADALLGPFFDTRQGSLTLPTVVTKGFAAPVNTVFTTDWLWFFKSSLTELDEECQFTSGPGSQKANDMTTWDASSGAAIFDPSTSEGMMQELPNQVGMFMVGNGMNGDENAMAGETIFLSLTSSGFFFTSYRMINDPLETTTSNFDDVAYGAFGSPVTVAPLLMWQPGSLFLTNWIVSVVDANMQNTNLWVEVQVATPIQGSNGAGTNYTLGRFYDRDGVQRTTSQRVTVRCIGALTVQDLLGAGGISIAPNGGWAHLGIRDLDFETTPLDAAFTLDRGILVGKIENLGEFSLYTSQNRTDF
jgi:hypothetical protein